MQYTSGSTSEPKGVMVTHGNLSANLQAIVTALRAGSDTVVASWLPQYHDMGLIGAYLGALYCGGCGEARGGNQNLRLNLGSRLRQILA